MKKIYEIITILGILTIAGYLDIIYQKVKQVNPVLMHSTTFSQFWLRILSTVFITLLLLSISWYLLRPSSRYLVVTIACILSGATALLVLTIPGIRLIGQLNLTKTMVGSWVIDIVSSDLSLTSHSAAFILCIGVIRLLPRKYQE